MAWPLVLLLAAFPENRSSKQLHTPHFLGLLSDTNPPSVKPSIGSTLVETIEAQAGIHT